MLGRLISTSMALAALVLIVPSWANADPGVSMSLPDEASSGKWFGAASNARIGQISTGGPNSGVISIGPRSDVEAIGVTSTATSARGAYILNPKIPQAGERDLAALEPQHGYLASLSNSSGRLVDAGDQNDDGESDVAIGATNRTVYVLYAIDDASVLPDCSVSITTKCLDVAGITSDDGFKITDSTSGSGFGSYIGNAGDFNGDGVDDLVVTDSNFDGGRGSAYLIYGGRTSDLDIATMTSADGIQIPGPGVGALFGFTASGIGDVNGDGLDDIGVYSAMFSGEIPPALYVIYGVDDAPSTIATDTFSTEDGFRAIGFEPFQIVTPSPAGDVNGDGVADFLIAGPGPPFVGNPDGVASVIYGSSNRTESTVDALEPETGDGYTNVAPGEESRLGQVAVNLGDLNGDGVPDQLVSATGASMSETVVGAVEVLFGQRPTPGEPINVGTGLIPDNGIALVGGNSNGATGAAAPLGDVDKDGLPDFVVSTPSIAQASRSNAGMVQLVLGSTLVGQALTGPANSIGEDGAKLNGVVRSNGREGMTYFEYGTTTDYGSQTTEVSVEANRSNTATEADLTGLEPGTEYHFRSVIVNELGLIAFGPDRTFTTDEVPTPPPGPCEADPKAPGCPAYNYCEANPGAQGCAEPVARLSGLIAGASTGKVRRGGKVVVRGWITSTGTKSVEGVRVCAKVPKRLIRVIGKRCRRVGSLAPGKTARVQFRLKVKAKARKGAKPTIRLVASAGGLANRSAETRFAIR